MHECHCIHRLHRAVFIRNHIPVVDACPVLADDQIIQTDALYMEIRDLLRDLRLRFLKREILVIQRIYDTLCAVLICPGIPGAVVPGFKLG